MGGGGDLYLSKHRLFSSSFNKEPLLFAKLIKPDEFGNQHEVGTSSVRVSSERGPFGRMLWQSGE